MLPIFFSRLKVNPIFSISWKAIYLVSFLSVTLWLVQKLVKQFLYYCKIFNKPRACLRSFFKFVSKHEDKLIRLAYLGVGCLLLKWAHILLFPFSIGFKFIWGIIFAFFGTLFIIFFTFFDQLNEDCNINKKKHFKERMKEFFSYQPLGFFPLREKNRNLSQDFYDSCLNAKPSLFGHLTKESKTALIKELLDQTCKKERLKIERENVQSTSLWTSDLEELSEILAIEDPQGDWDTTSSSVYATLSKEEQTKLTNSCLMRIQEGRSLRHYRMPLTFWMDRQANLTEGITEEEVLFHPQTHVIMETETPQEASYFFTFKTKEKCHHYVKTKAHVHTPVSPLVHREDEEDENALPDAHARTTQQDLASSSQQLPSRRRPSSQALILAMNEMDMITEEPLETPPPQRRRTSSSSEKKMEEPLETPPRQERRTSTSSEKEEASMCNIL